MASHRSGRDAEESAPKNEVNISGVKIEGHHSVISQGGHVDIHHDEGKDRLIEAQERQVVQMFTALMEDLRGFHEVGARRTDKKIRIHISRVL